MSWIRENGTASLWQRRAALSVDNTAGGAGAFDAQLVVPQDWDPFWTQCHQTDARDVRVRRADGLTAVTKYDFAGLVMANRELTIEIQDTAAAAGMLLYWLYWANTAAADAKSAFAPAGPKTCYAELAAPGRRAARVEPESYGVTKPRTLWTKTANEEVFAWFDFGPVLHARRAAFQGASQLEELSRVSAVDVTLNAVSQAAMFDLTKTRFASPAVVGVHLKAGDSGFQYTVICRVVTTNARTLEARALLDVRNYSEV